jgi:hypothetical protein
MVSYMRHPRVPEQLVSVRVCCMSHQLQQLQWLLIGAHQLATCGVAYPSQASIARLLKQPRLRCGKAIPFVKTVRCPVPSAKTCS